MKIKEKVFTTMLGLAAISFMAGATTLVYNITSEYEFNPLNVTLFGLTVLGIVVTYAVGLAVQDMLEFMND